MATQESHCFGKNLVDKGVLANFAFVATANSDRAKNIANEAAAAGTIRSPAPLGFVGGRPVYGEVGAYIRTVPSLASLNHEMSRMYPLVTELRAPMTPRNSRKVRILSFLKHDSEDVAGQFRLHGKKTDQVAPGGFCLVHRRIRAFDDFVGAGFVIAEQRHADAGRA